MSDQARAAVARAVADVRRAATASGRVSIGGLCWIEGRRAHERALRAGAAIDRVLWAAPDGSARAVERFERLLETLRDAGAALLETDAATLAELTDGRTRRGPVGLARIPPWAALAPLAASARGRLLVVADVEDPGNVGALARTALAAGAAGVVVTGISDPWHPRAVRTSMGSVFKLPLVCFDDAGAARDALRAAGVRTLAAVSRGGVAPDDVARDSPLACFVGGEAFGLDRALVDTLDLRVTIPMSGAVDSFSVNAAAAILLYALRA